MIDNESERGTKLGKLRGQLARPNPQAQAMIEFIAIPWFQVLEDILVVFTGPVHHYVTPKLYKETRPATGNIVPAWNYEGVQVYGRAKIYTDTKCTDFGKFLNKQLSDLSAHAETSLLISTEDPEGRPRKVSDAPASYIR